MTRRALGRGRPIIVVGALISLVGSLPAWWTIGGTVTQPITGNAFEGAGIIVFISALALLALIVLPFAKRDGESALDRAASFVLLGGLMIGGFLWRLYEVNQFGGLGMPDRGPGMWISGLGVAVVAWGVAELLAERPAE